MKAAVLSQVRLPRCRVGGRCAHAGPRGDEVLVRAPTLGVVDGLTRRGAPFYAGHTSA